MSIAAHHSMMGGEGIAPPLPTGYTPITAVIINNGRNPGSGFTLNHKWNELGLGRLVVDVEVSTLHNIMLFTGNKSLTSYKTEGPWIGYGNPESGTLRLEGAFAAGSTPLTLPLNVVNHCEILAKQSELNSRYIGVGSWGTDNGWSYLDAKYYGLQIYKADDSLLCDLIPCIRDADNKAGFYDVIDGVFIRSTKGYDYDAVI